MDEKGMSKIKVGVFSIPNTNMLAAYTRPYGKLWRGRVEHICTHIIIDAPNGAAAKRAAIAEHREFCVKA